MTKFRKIIIISNPASTNARHLAGRVEELKRLFPTTPFTIIETLKDGRRANQEQLITHKSLFGPQTLLCIAAGDGTVNLVIETLLTEPTLTSRMRKTPVLPLWGGNANDLGHMLNGYSRFMRLQSLFKHGKVIEVRPLRVTLSTPGHTTIKIAACYVSFGATAFAADRINNPSHRNMKLRRFSVFRLVLELRTVIRAFIDVPRFIIREKGTEKHMYEYAFINGSRIAKFERMPIRLTDNAFYIVKLFRKHPATLLYILQILRKQRFGRITSNRRTFTILKPTWLQVDGEVIRIKANTTVDISLNDKPFYALSKRLRNPKQ